jgi:hypothetical protein
MSILDFICFTWTADKCVPFIREHHNAWSETSSERLYKYLAWFAARDLLAVSFVGEEVNAVCTIKLFDRMEQWLALWPYDPHGRFVMIDLMVAITPVAMADCFDKLLARWGKREVVIWERLDRTEGTDKAPRMYTWQQFEKLARRLTYGLTEDTRSNSPS